jgi:hypothetical protein
MFFEVSFIGLFLFFIQELGIALGLGGQMALLAAYSLSIEDGVVDPREAQFHRAVRGVLHVGLFCIVTSGAVISLIHFLTGEVSTLMEPAYLFKVALIILATVLSLLSLQKIESTVMGLAGGTWSALFVLHIFGPVTTWPVLTALFVVWMVIFNIIWKIWVYFKNENRTEAPAPAKQKSSPKIALAPLSPKLEPRVNPLLNEMPKKMVAPLAPPVVKKPVPPPPAPPIVVRAPSVTPMKPPPPVVPDFKLVPPLDPIKVAPPMPANTAGAVTTPAPKPAGLPGIQVMAKTPEQLPPQNTPTTQAH